MAFRAVRTAVSRKKRRFIQDGFDLDLSYILPNVIAMGFPSQKTEGLYRNKLSTVLKFLRYYHDENWRIYNLCSERAYDPDKFDGRVARYPFDDHNPPHLSTIKAFVLDAIEWLARGPENVAAVHCKAGKGRTGVAICCLLLSQDTCLDAEHALSFFGEKRTHNSQGVTIPSQKRFVGYWETIVRAHGGIIPKAPELLFWGIRMNYIPRVANSSFYVRMFCEGFEVFSSSPESVNPKDSYMDFNTYGMAVQGHIKVVIYTHQIKDDEDICHFWLHTAFLPSEFVHLEREEIDVANKDKKGRFHHGFSINAYFGSARLPSDTRSQALGSVAVISSTVVTKIMELPVLPAPPPFSAPPPPPASSSSSSPRDGSDYDSVSPPYSPLLSNHPSSPSLSPSPSPSSATALSTATTTFAFTSTSTAPSNSYYPPRHSSFPSSAYPLLLPAPPPPPPAYSSSSLSSLQTSIAPASPVPASPRSFFSAHRPSISRESFVKARPPSPAPDSCQLAKSGSHRIQSPRFFALWTATTLRECRC